MSSTLDVLGGYEFRVNPSRSPDGEYVYMHIEKGPMFAQVYLTRQEAFDLGAELAHAAEWLRREDDHA